MSQYEWIEAAGIDFSADLTEDPCVVSASEVDVMRLLENLFSNAKKYAKSRVGIRLSKSAEGSTELLFFNDGEFIAGEDMEAIFRPFYRSASGDTPGSGLGLYVVKRIVEKYHGRINARIDENGYFEIKIFF